MIGLRAIQPDVAVIKVMSIPDNRGIRVVIPDDHVPNEFHEILIHDITGVNHPGVPWDTSWVFQLGCVGKVENMAKSRMPVRNLWKSE